MTHDDNFDTVVLLNSDSQYLKNYQNSVDKWIGRFVENQKLHVLTISASEPKQAEAVREDVRINLD